MLKTKTNKLSLLQTTALIGVAFLCVQAPASAASFNFTTTGNTGQTLNNGETGVVQTGGAITAATTAIVVNGQTALSLSNSGTIDGGNVALNLENGGDLSSGISNTLHATLSAGSVGVFLGNSTTLSGNIDNSGVINAAIDFYLIGSSNISGTVTNEASGTISSGIDAAFYIKNGSDISGVVNNEGLISGTAGFVVDGSGSHLTGSVTNSGTISGSSAGFHVKNLGTFSGTIDNSGTIHGDKYGIFADQRGDISGTIDNSGTISGNNFGLLSSGSSDISGVINNETGGLISGGTNGIQSQSSSDISGRINNSGTIHGDKYGIYAYNSNISGVIANKSGGVISGSSYGIGAISAADLSGGIDNSGVIHGSKSGILLKYLGSDISGGIVNRNGGTISGDTDGILSSAFDLTGDIDNAAGANISGGTYGVRVRQGDISGHIKNSGTIKGQFGIATVSTGNISGGLENTAGGVISGSSSGVFVSGLSNIAGGLDNSGTIYGAQVGVSVQNQGKLTGGVTNESGGTIEGGGGIAISLNNLNGMVPLTVNGGHIIGDVIDYAPTNGYSPVTIGGDFSTEGNFTVSSVTVNSGKTLTISSGDAVTMATMPSSTGHIAIGVTSAADHGTLMASNSALTLSSGMITAAVAASPTLTDGTSFLVASGNAPVVGGPGITPQSITDNSLLWDFQLVDGAYGSLGGSDSDLYFLVSASSGPAFTPTTPGNLSVYNALVGLSGTTDPEISQAINNVGSASSSSASYNGALSSLLPDMNGASFQAAQNVSNAAQSLVSRWLSGGTGMSSGNNPLNGLLGWGQVFGQHADQQTRSGIAGYRADTGGFALGLDTGARYETGKIGAALTYGHTFAQSDNANKAASGINSYAFTVYGQYHLPQDYYLRGMTTYVHGDTDTVRHNVGGTPGLNARGNFGSNQYTLRSLLAKDYAYKGATVTPHVLLDYTHYMPDDYTETGAGGANLHVTQKAVNMANIGFGATTKWHLQQKSGAVVMPELSAAYRYDLVGDRLTATSSFAGGGSAFTAPGPVPARGQLDLGTGVTYKTAAGWDLKAHYDFSYRSTYTAHAATVKLTQQF